VKLRHAASRRSTGSRRGGRPPLERPPPSSPPGHWSCRPADDPARAEPLLGGRAGARNLRGPPTTGRPGTPRNRGLRADWPLEGYGDRLYCVHKSHSPTITTASPAEPLTALPARRPGARGSRSREGCPATSASPRRRIRTTADSFYVIPLDPGHARCMPEGRADVGHPHAELRAAAVEQGLPQTGTRTSACAGGDGDRLESTCPGSTSARRRAVFAAEEGARERDRELTNSARIGRARPCVAMPRPGTPHHPATFHRAPARLVLGRGQRRRRRSPTELDERLARSPRPASASPARPLAVNHVYVGRAARAARHRAGAGEPRRRDRRDTAEGEGPKLAARDGGEPADELTRRMSRRSSRRA